MYPTLVPGVRLLQPLDKLGRTNAVLAHRTLIAWHLKGLQDIAGFTSVHWHMELGGKGLSD